MKNVILYGGAFNPPTLAHEKIVTACIELAKNNQAEVWLMPSGSRPDKSIQLSTSERLKILKAFVRGFDGSVRLEDCELMRGEIIETYKTRDYLQGKYPDHTFTWVFGSDSIQTMRTWGDGEGLWNDLFMLLVNRPGYVCADVPPNATLLEIDTPTLSSTMVRKKIEEGSDVSDLVPKSIWQFI